MSESTSPYWWVSSGGRFCNQNGLGMTLQGNLPSNDSWRLAYSSSNPTDTDDGYHPQNIFRLVARYLWKNFQQTAYFKIQQVNLSSSPNRNASNGLLFFHRYQDSQNLYYAGIRVDGAVVIKKKINGTYYTMAYRSGVYPGAYDRNTNPNLLPVGRWIALRTTTSDLGSSGVRLQLQLNDPNLGSGWIPLVSADDTGQFGGAAILASGRAGIRTDFMDVQFDNYEALDTSCAGISISPESATFSRSGGIGTVKVSAGSSCNWKAASNAWWLKVTSGQTGTGNGSVTYSVAKTKNGSSKARKAELTIGGRSFVVTQWG